MNQGSGKAPPSTTRGRAGEKAGLWGPPEWPAATARDSQEPQAKPYPETLAGKRALSAALVANLGSEQHRALSAVQKTGGAWKQGSSSSFQFAERYAAALLNEESILGVLNFAQDKPAKELARTWNRPDRKLLEPLSRMHVLLHEGDLWMGRSLAQHAAVFVQIEKTNGVLDPARTVMGQAFARSEGKEGGTGEFQLLTLSHLHEFMLANEPGFALADQWVLHRYLALKG